jgi:hypothetical protein
MTPCGNNGWEQLQKDQKSDSSFGLISLFHNTPEKMPAVYVFFGLAGTLKKLQPVLNQDFNRPPAANTRPGYCCSSWPH